MAITFSVEAHGFKLQDRQRIKKWIVAVVSATHKKVGDIGYLFCEDRYLLEVNKQYLNHDTLTDIITFDYVEGDTIAGDILISVERVEENAVAFGVTFRRELLRVIIHGVLHLLGQGDKTPAEAAQMRSKEDEALQMWDEMTL